MPDLLLLEALEDAEFLLRKLSINPKEAPKMADSIRRCATDLRNAQTAELVRRRALLEQP